MLHEASSVSKAIQKAWEQAGCPEEFTIKVLEVEKRGFAGLFVKSPAVVSITYAPPTKQKSRSGSTDRQHQQKRSRSRHENKDRGNSSKHVDNHKSSPEKKRSSNHGQQFNNPNHDVKPRDVVSIKKEKQVIEGWTQEQVQFIEKALKELNVHVAITAPFSLNTEKKVLHVVYDGAVCEKGEDERTIFISISHLLMQYLKKNFKRKFRGYHILVAKKS